MFASGIRQKQTSTIGHLLMFSAFPDLFEAVLWAQEGHLRKHIVYSTKNQEFIGEKKQT